MLSGSPQTTRATFVCPKGQLGADRYVLNLRLGRRAIYAARSLRGICYHIARPSAIIIAAAPPRELQGRWIGGGRMGARTEERATSSGRENQAPKTEMRHSRGSLPRQSVTYIPFIMVEDN